MANDLHEARLAKKNEFYTQYEDIQKEINSYLEYNPDTFRDKTIFLPCDDPEWSNFTKFFVENFKDLGLKKLISTSYATNSKNKQITIFDYISDFEINSKQYNADITNERGKIFVLTRKNQVKININDLNWKYLEGDGDFRSEEVTKIRDEVDMIITNPPFSLFREFLHWIVEADKQFLIIGNLNSVTYKDVFPLIMNNKMWLGESIHSGDRKFYVPDAYPLDASSCGVDNNGRRFVRVKGVRWYTNLDHGRRHQPIELMSKNDNLKYNKKFIKYLKTNFDLIEYPQYNNYIGEDGSIDVKYSDAIPNDFDGLMGVPVSFIDKYCPEQFEIVGCADADVLPENWVGAKKEFVDLYLEQGNTGQYTEGNRLANFVHNGIAMIPYKRILIRRRKG